jgi:hydroxyacylglutathione hydrolase
MIFERIKSEGIAHISYLIGSNDEMVVIDPRRDCQVYIDLAKREGMRIKYIFETHRNEDYAIGSLELAHFTGAKIYHGPGLDFKYGETLKDGQEFYFGTLKLTAIHTPGHTDESMSCALADLTVGEEPIMVFTGDALFVGDVGRTDLFGPKEVPRMAENLYNSIFNRLLPLGDRVILCPAHGGGSACGGAISEREESTLGLERVQNPVLQETKKEDFIQFKVAEYLERPPYFRKMEQYNLEGAPLLEHLPNPSPLSPKELQKQMNLGAVLVDTRTPSAFGGAHIKSSYSIWLDGLSAYAGWVLPYDKPIFLVLEENEQLERAVRYLFRLGYDQVAGHLNGGVEAWCDEALPIESLGLLTAQELKKRLDRGDLVVLDVREKKEWDSGHIEGALHIHFGHLQERLNEVPSDRPIAAICDVGHRASLGASILRREGYQEAYNVLGGMTAWRNAGYNMVK